VQNKKKRVSLKWHTIDLHLHTPASNDYQQPNVTFLDILRQAEARGLAIIAFTDHNTVAGYRKMQEEIKQLEMLEQLNRILPEEQNRLVEYRRLLGKILVIPGFEFTATFGFHILGIFPPEKPVREIEHLLLDLKIPADKLDDGSATIGASSDVLTAYRLIDEAGGIAIAAHANSNNGVAMRGFPLGGQTKIAYTQDSHLFALEVTDLDHKGRQTTAAFFSGRKPEYPRRLHCIQGSDSHRLTSDTSRKKNLGVGERTTDVLLPEINFDALKELFQSNDFARTRPHRHTAEPAFDFILSAREEGSNIIQDFHESMTIRAGKRYAIIADVCAFANTNGGTLYIGLSADPKKPVIGVPEPKKARSQLEKEIGNRLSPPLTSTLDIQKTNGKNIIRVLVPRGEDPPYAVDDNKIYIRSETETGLAVRDEIVVLVKRGPGQLIQPGEPTKEHLPTAQLGEEAKPKPDHVVQEEKIDIAPRTGVEVVSVEERNGKQYYSMRDLRNGNVVKNVTQTSARRLWHYAITRFAKLPKNLSGVKIQWQGKLGLIRRYTQGKRVRYDLIQSIDDGNRYYFGVTEDGIHGEWKQLVGQEDE
jgi:hypothetical protein